MRFSAQLVNNPNIPIGCRLWSGFAGVVPQGLPIKNADYTQVVVGWG